MPAIIIDHIETLTIDAARGAAHENERLAIVRLAHGMRSLYSQVKHYEAAAVRVLGTPPGGRSFVWGNAPGLKESGIDKTFISCAFDWYAINACRLFQLIGFVCEEYGGRMPEVKAYCRRVCGPVLTYRHKVAAHYALTHPNNDNEADRYISTMDTVAFETDRYFVGSLRAGIGRGATSVESQHDYHWSLTAFHEDVVLRRLERPA